MRLLPLDYVVILLIAVFLLLFSLLFFRAAEGEVTVYIMSESGEQVYPLNQTDIMLTLTGPLGETRVAIGQGVVRVISSPGREQICVNRGAISQHGEWLICLPNQIFIRIVANEPEVELDAYSY